MLSFVDATCATVKIEATGSIATAKGRSESGAATDRIYTEEKETNTLPRVDVSSQAKFVAEEKEADRSVPESVLERLSVSMLKELKRDDRRAFEGYEPILNRGSRSATYKRTLKRGDDDDKLKNLECVSVSWNATGRQLFAAFGHREFEDYSEDKGIVCSWAAFQEGDQPTWSYEHSTCFTSMACHPERPSVVAASTMLGEIMVFDSVAADEQILAVTDIAEYSHCGPIKTMEWIRCDNDGVCELVSLGGIDGKLIWWRFDLDAKTTVQPLPRRGVVVAATAAEISRPKFKSNGGAAMSRVSNGAFIVGCQNGKLLGVRTCDDGYGKKIVGPKKLGKLSLQWDRDAQAFLLHLPKVAQQKLVRHVEQFHSSQTKPMITLLDVLESNPKLHYINSPPFGAVTEYMPHDADLTAVVASPFHRNVFLAASSDGIVAVYSALQTAPLFDVEKIPYTEEGDVYLDEKRKSKDLKLYAADWSRGRPTVFATGGDDAIVRVYDLDRNQEAPSLELLVPVDTDALSDEEADRHATVFSLAFNPRQRDYIAAADAAGRIHLWQLPWHLARAKTNEVDNLERLIQTYFFDEEEEEKDEE